MCTTIYCVYWRKHFVDLGWSMYSTFSTMGYASGDRPFFTEGHEKKNVSLRTKNLKFFKKINWINMQLRVEIFY